jgi:hypothetical protein
MGGIGMKKIFLATATVAVFALLVSSPALAAKGGKGGGGVQAVAAPAVTLDQPSPKYGDWVSFSATYPSMHEMALVWVSCSQGGQNVYQSGGSPGGWFVLGGVGVSSGWTGGAANCTATLYYNTYQGQVQTGSVTLATRTFDVAA